MRFFLLLIVLFILDLYIFQAFRILAQNWSAQTRTVVYAAFWAIPLLTASFFLLNQWFDFESWDKNVYTVLRTLVFIAYLSKLMILPFLLIDDTRRLFLFGFEGFGRSTGFNPGRSRFISQIGLLMGSLPFLSLTYGMIRNPYRYKVFRERVPVRGLPVSLHGLRIVQISDIHSGSFMFKEPVQLAIDLINQQNPDLVVFTGDLVNERADEMEPFIDVFDKIRAKMGVFSILGNHDYGDYHQWENEEAREKNFDLLKSTHQRLGWDLLLNDNRILEVNGEKIAVIGVENYSAHPRFPKHGDLEKAAHGTETASFKLLLSHDPSHWEDQVTHSFQDIHLTLSGHTHGMQFGVEIPGWIKWSPIKYMYKQWAGLYRNGEQFLYVNRGLGFLGYPGRVGILPEITLLELEAAGSLDS